VALAGTLPFAVLAVVLMRLCCGPEVESVTGKEELIGAPGIAVAQLPAGSEGMIACMGLWRAESSRPAGRRKPSGFCVSRTEAVR